MRSLLLGVATFTLFFSVDAALSCGPTNDDVGAWTLDHKDYAGVRGLPFLSPGNDSRINLQLLMLDEGPPPTANPVTPPDMNAIDVTPALFPMSSLATVYPAKPGAPAAAPSADFADGEGSRCLSLKSGAQAFTAAIEAEKGVSDAERKLLIDARSAMKPTCADDKAARPPLLDPLAGLAQSSAPAREFAAYLAGAQSFYVGAFDQALAQFGQLARSDNAWLRETALYMTGRSLLNKAQVGAFDTFDEVGLPKVSDKASLADSQTGLSAYLAAYPAGAYAASARGLMRRVYWLADDKQRLSVEYAKLIADAPRLQASLPRVDLAQEVDSKYLNGIKVEYADSNNHDARLLAVEGLMRMRWKSPKKPDFPAAELDRQAPDFGGHEKLFSYLKAARAYYVDGDPRSALALLGPPPPGALSPPFLAFSAETLRGQALMASGELQAAVDQWTSLLPRAAQPWQKEAVELGLAQSWERLGTINKVFLPETRIVSPRIRAILLRQSAGPILLRMALADAQSTPDERNLARTVLLFKEATRGQYDNFQRDFKADELARDAAVAKTGWAAQARKLLWDGQAGTYACPALKATIGELAANPRSSHALLCLGEFVRTQDLDGFEDNRSEAGELGSGKSIFPGQPFARGEIYKTLIADKATSEKDRGYALFRAVRCYAPAGHNTCGGVDVDKDQRKAWFTMLKTKYASTAWARSLNYYW